MDIRIDGTRAVAGVDGSSTTNDVGRAEAPLLPEPGPPISPAALAALVLEASKSSRAAHRAAKRAESEERTASQEAEISKMHEEADNAFVGGLVSGGLQVGAGAMSFVSALDTSESQRVSQSAQEAANPNVAGAATDASKLANQAARWQLGAAVTNAGNTFAQSVTQAKGKDLEADAKTAQMKAETAKDERDDAAEGLRAQNELEQAFLQAYQALLASQSQVLQATMGSRA